MPWSGNERQNVIWFELPDILRRRVAVHTVRYVISTFDEHETEAPDKKKQINK